MTRSSSRPFGGSDTELTRESRMSIRWKFMLIIAGSGIIAIVGTGALLGVAFILLGAPLVGPVLNYLAGQGFAPLIILGTGIVLFLGSFLLISRGTLRDLSTISNAVNQIAAGNLDVQIPVHSGDELGRLAQDVNEMAARLKKSIQEEREAERAKNELITSVSHDLRTPLTSILGYLELVDDDKYEDEVELRHYVAIAHDKAKSLKKLIDDLFEFTTVSYGGPRYHPETVNLGRLLEQLSEEFVPILQKADMEYRLKLPPAKVNVRADPALLVRVFENLLSNAVRYGSDGRFVDIELETSDEWAIAKIANYGSPIPEAQLAHIFERFTRVEESRSRHTGGAGLGLAIAKSIVDLHQGVIRAYNENDRTVFEVGLRLDKNAG